MIELALIGAAAAGAGLGAGALVGLACAPRAERAGPARARPDPRLARAAAGAQEMLRRWEAYIRPRLDANCLAGRATPPAAGLVLAAGTLAALAAVLGFLHNPVAAAAVGVSVALLPEWLYLRAREARRERLLAALPAAAQSLAAQLADTPNLKLALAETARHTPPPLAGLLRRAAQELEAGHPPEEVCARLARGLDSDHGRVFARVLLAAFREPAVHRLLPRLAARLSARRALSRKALAVTAAERATGLVLNLVAPAVCAFAVLFIPDTPRYLSGTVPGRVVVAAWALSLAGGLWLDRAVRRVG